MINSVPEIVGLTSDLHEDFIQAPAPLGHLARLLTAGLLDLFSEERTETVDPFSNAPMANIKPSLMEKVFNAPQRQRKPDIHRHWDASDLQRRLEGNGTDFWASSDASLVALPGFIGAAPIAAEGQVEVDELLKSQALNRKCVTLSGKDTLLDRQYVE